MKRAHLIKLAIMLLVSSIVGTAASAYAPPATNRVEMDFNGNWKYYQGDATGAQATSFSDGSWESVVLPHSTKFITPDDFSNYNGICWYRKHFQVDNAFNGRKVYLQFGAAMQAANVYINGTQVGAQHAGGYMEFTRDITSALVYGGDNVVAVKVNSNASADWAPGKAGVDFKYYGGLYRDVVMVVTDKLHVTDAVFANKVAGGGIYVTYPSISSGSAAINIKTHVINENAGAKTCTVFTEIVDAQGAVVGNPSTTVTVNQGVDTTVSQSATISNPRLWHPNTPYLYTVYTTIKDGSAPVDFYKTRIGLRTIQWTRNQGLLINGARLKAQGVNVHQDLYGLGNAIPRRAIYFEVKRVKEAGFQFIRGSHYPHHPAFYDACDELGILVQNSITGWQNYVTTTTFSNNCQAETKALIRRDRNHPCVAIWETQLNESNYTTAWANTMNNLAHQEGTQIVTCGTLSSDQGGWSKAGTSTNPVWDVMIGASQHDVRNNSSSKPVIIAEYGDWDYGGTTSTSRVRREGAEAPLLQQVYNLQESLNKNRALSWCSADGYWVWNDYNGCWAGVMDMYRIPKFSYYFYQSQRDPSLTSAAFNSGPMVYIANRWTSGSPTTVKVFSNCDSVSLYRNGTLIGTRRPDNDVNCGSLSHPPFTFTNVTFAAGELKAVGKIGATQVTFIRNTPGAATAVKLRAENDTLWADGSDARLLWIDIVDANGTVVPNSTASVSVNANNGAKVIGPATVAMKGGQLAVWVRSTTAPGPVTVTATSGSLTPGTYALISRSPSVRIGYSGKAPVMNSPLSSSTFFRLAGDKLVIPHEFQGTIRTIAVYSISGKLIMRVPLKTQCVDLRKDLGISRGTYIIKFEAKGLSGL
ncbi:MAG: DUF4982 domain-containing protein [Chitinispirillaceae bacterium]|nr:DUF4982 domain-containing protein [Chitinispirillaceae bacterium]